MFLAEFAKEAEIAEEQLCALCILCELCEKLRLGPRVRGDDETTRIVTG
jgi:hypothetical protein